MWSDITELCRNAAAEMTNQNPMINIETFSLHDAMSAVEVKEVPLQWRCWSITIKLSYPYYVVRRTAFSHIVLCRVGLVRSPAMGMSSHVTLCVSGYLNNSNSPVYLIMSSISSAFLWVASPMSLFLYLCLCLLFFASYVYLSIFQKRVYSSWPSSTFCIIHHS